MKTIEDLKKEVEKGRLEGENNLDWIERITVFAIDVGKNLQVDMPNVFDNTVFVKHQDGSKFQITHASCHVMGEFLVVFAEHNPVMVWFKDDLEGTLDNEN